MTDMTDEEVQAACDALGLVLDGGCLIQGPFIPDGTCRIYPKDEPYQILGSGETPQDAWDGLPLSIDGKYIR